VAAPAHALSLSVDPSFSTDGLVHTAASSGGGTDAALGVVVQPDGKMIAAGVATESDGPRALIARYDTDGSLDPTFDGDSGSGNGVVTTPSIVENAGVVGIDVALQQDGKIVVAGREEAAPLPDGNWGGDDFVALRYLPDGRLDRSFGTEGRVIVKFSDLGDSAQAVAIQPDGKIVLAGTAFGVVAFVRLNPDGSLDETFDGDGGDANGKIELDDSNIESAQAVLITPDGKILGAGNSDGGTVALIRLLADGSRDASFDGDSGTGNGEVISEWSIGYEIFHSVALTDEGKILAAGAADGQDLHALVARYNDDGTSDGSFGDGGLVFTPGPRDSATAVIPLPGGEVAVGGQSRGGDHSDIAIFALNSDGTFDTSAARGGVFRASIGEFDATGDAALAPGRTIVAAGTTASGPPTWDDVAAARFLLDAPKGGGEPPGRPPSDGRGPGRPMPVIVGGPDIGALKPGRRGYVGFRGVRIRCPSAASHACVGNLRLTLRLPRTIHRSASFITAPGGSSKVRVKLPVAVRSRLDHHKRVPGLAELHVSMRGGQAVSRVIHLELRHL
jgi:uncharacterized delta-60 repeat protein